MPSFKLEKTRTTLEAVDYHLEKRTKIIDFLVFMLNQKARLECNDISGHYLKLSKKVSNVSLGLVKFSIIFFLYKIVYCINDTV